MSRVEPPEIHGWKAIAARLGRSVRTVQLWENERGLPIQRVPGGNGNVYIRRDKLEEWLAGQERGESLEKVAPPLARRRLPLLIIAIVLPLVAATAWWIRFAGPPVKWSVSGDSLIVENGRGAELWRTELDGGLTQKSPDSDRFSPRFIDLDDDGTVELLFVQVPGLPDRQDTLFCFSSDGKELWRFETERVVSTVREAFDAFYFISAVKTGRLADGSQVVVVGSHHRLHYPSRIAVLAADGQLINDYWHSGHIGTDADRLQLYDLDHDGSFEIYAGGINNARDIATLVVLDPEHMDGASQETKPEYQFLGLPRGRQIARVFFPRSSMNELEYRYNDVYNLLLAPRTITVAVHEAVDALGAPTVHYKLDSSLSLVDFQLSSTFEAAHNKLLREGLVSRTLSQEYEALRDVYIER